jgi:hypothetical protein
MQAVAVAVCNLLERLLVQVVLVLVVQVAQHREQMVMLHQRQIQAVAVVVLQVEQRQRQLVETVVRVLS